MTEAKASPDLLRELPSVDALLARPAVRALESALGRAALKAAARAAVADARAPILAGAGGAGPDVGDAEVIARALRASAPSLRRVINATGIPLHTNLGRAPLHPEAVANVAAIAAGYSSLEIDLGTGRRGHRADHVAALLCQLFGAEAAFAVNNCAGATLLGLAAVGAGGAAVVSRGELVEIGGGFRVPEILVQSGCKLVEVGTTNKTRLADYAAALDALGAGEQGALDRAGSGARPPALLLRVHRSNFALLGFTDQPGVGELAALARARGVPLIHDLGSGAAASPAAAGLPPEPTAADSLRAGASLVLASGDKLLGGPQAGLLLGEQALIDRCRAHPLARALRLDKLLLAALEATLRLHLAGRGDELPALAALGATADQLEQRAVALQVALRARGIEAAILSSEGRVGGGSLPLARLASRAVALALPEGVEAASLAATLRRGRLPLPPVALDFPPELRADLAARGLGEPACPVLALVREGTVLLDVRCLLPGEEITLADAVASALQSLHRGIIDAPGRNRATLEEEEEV